MYRTFFTLFLTSIILGHHAHSQYVTPGDNLVISPESLVDLSQGVVTHEDGVYYIHDDLTISPTDTFRIGEAAVIRTAADKRINIMGAFFSAPDDGQVVFTAQDTTSAAGHFRGFRFEDADSSEFRNTVVKYGGGIQLIGSEVLFDSCVIRNNGHANVSGAINYSNASPIIRNCTFIENSRAAIASGASVTGSPRIYNNTFIHNSTENSNRPQINLGPGATDTLYIVGNYIEGMYEMAGGIAVSNLFSTGNTLAVISDNVVVGNRYGYAQTGNNMSTVVTGNVLIDNNIQGEPMQGGSGLNFFGDTDNYAVVRDNLISGNLWGITIQSAALPDLGTEEDPGGNVIFDNENSGIEYALYNNTPNDIYAMGNYWGDNDPADAENVIVHAPDDPSLGLVTYEPVMELHPVLLSFVFPADQSPLWEENIQGIIDEDSFTVELEVPYGSDVSSLVPGIVVPLGVSTEPALDEPMDFTQEVVYTLSTPHGDQQEYTVDVDIAEPETYTLSFVIVDEQENPVEDALITLDGVEHEPGHYVFEDMLSGVYDYWVSRENFPQASGQVEITDEDLEVEVMLEGSLNVEQEASDELRLYPNPAVSYFIMEITRQEPGVMIVTDLTGKEVMRQKVHPGQNRWDVAHLPQGLYLVILETSHDTYMRKLNILR